MRTRVYVDWEGVLTELHPGATLIGRDLDCRVRFNDSLISRRHVRFVVSDDGIVTIEDLKSRNGTNVNGKPLVAPATLSNGDEIEIGSRKFLLRVEEYDPAAQDFAAEQTEEGLSAEIRPSKAILEHACPRCRFLFPKTHAICPSCKYRPPFVRPGALTAERKVVAPSDDRRDQERRPIYVPVCYASDNLTFDGVARDLSRGGMFVESEFLDPVGTTCQITALPDGAPPVTFACRVAHVIESTSDGNRCGIGVQFTRLGPEAESWLIRSLETAKPSEARKR